MKAHPGLTGLFLGVLLLVTGCAKAPEGTVITFPASAVGKESEILRTQLARFQEQHPDITIEMQTTPDDASQRHQLYVQWLNAGASDPDILQLDVIWTPEFAAAGWILPLDRFQPDADDFFPATLKANRYEGKLYALPWFVDVGMLYYRTDLVSKPPETIDDLKRTAESARAGKEVDFGFLWQGARYEGLICVFVEQLGAFGGQIMDDEGKIVVDSDAAVKALTFLRDSVYVTHITPESALTWQEEQTKLHFQNGASAYLRNWPYAYPLMEDRATSKVAGKFAVTLIPQAPGGHHTSALGGQQLAVNAHSEHPEVCYQIIDYLTRPEQMLERADVTGQFPPRRSVYDNPALAKALAIAPEKVRPLIEHAVPRPVTPVYTQLSEILQIWLSRALTRQVEPREALENASRQMRALMKTVGLDRSPGEPWVPGGEE